MIRADRQRGEEKEGGKKEENNETNNIKYMFKYGMLSLFHSADEIVINKFQCWTAYVNKPKENSD